MPATSDRRFTDRLVFLHGFTQTHHHWHQVAFALAARVAAPTVTLPDLPGHGLSSRDRTEFDAAAELLADRCGAGTYVGYSMGGRFALAAAIARPDLVERLVLIGATAGIADPDKRLTRRRLDDERAADLERVGVDEFLDGWLAAPMFTDLPADPHGLEHRRRNDAAGLAHSLRTCGTGAQTPLWDRLHEIGAPTLVLAGARDAKFTEIGRRLADGIANASFGVIPDAGHAAHTEQPAATVDTIAAWLTSA